MSARDAAHEIFDKWLDLENGDVGTKREIFAIGAYQAVGVYSRHQAEDCMPLKEIKPSVSLQYWVHSYVAVLTYSCSVLATPPPVPAMALHQQVIMS